MILVQDQTVFSKSTATHWKPVMLISQVSTTLAFKYMQCILHIVYTLCIQYPFIQFDAVFSCIFAYTECPSPVK